MSERTYIHKDSRHETGRHRPTSWHIARLHTRAINGWIAYCGRFFDTQETMTETPNAATCESCFRNEAKARERQQLEDDASTQPTETLP